MRVAQDPIYNVLADFTAILDEAYKQSDVTRSRAQVQAEALDVMLQTVSGDNREVSPAKLHELIRELVEHYRIVPRSFDEMLENIISERGTKKRAMTDDEKINDAFAAYLGTINQTEEMWRKDNTKRAEDAARFDLLLNAVAQAEKISVSEAELASLMRDIAEATGLELENVMAVVEPQPLREQLMRDKARELIVSSAKEATA